jgi:hypothetical protein
VLMSARVSHDILVYLRKQLIGCDVAVSIHVGLAFKPLDQVPGEYSVASAPVLPLLRDLVPRADVRTNVPGFDPAPRCNTIVATQLKNFHSASISFAGPFKMPDLGNESFEDLFSQAGARVGWFL